MAGILFLAPQQHSNLKLQLFGEALLEDLTHQQIDILRARVPSCDDFNNDELLQLLNVVSEIDAGKMTTKAARLKLLTLAASKTDYKANVIEGIADMLVKLPLLSISDQSSHGEVDLQTRFYGPLLDPMLADNIKKISLRWPNKEDSLTTRIRPDAIVSTIVQHSYGQSLAFGEVKPGDATTTTLSLCIDTLKLAMLSRNAIKEYGMPVLCFQINGFTLVFYMAQQSHPPVYTFTEIGRINMPKSLSSLHEFVNLKHLNILLSVTRTFWHCCCPSAPYTMKSSSSTTPLSSPSSGISSIHLPSPETQYASSSTDVSPQMMPFASPSSCLYSSPDTTALPTSSSTTANAAAAIEMGQLLRMINSSTSKSRRTDIQYQ
ncbi:hypothetical protein MBANPS3_009224 [Mucor bainieri]